MRALTEIRAYRAGIAVVTLTSLLTLWTTIVRDDGTGISWLLVIMAAGVAAFAAGFRPAGMARAALGIAVMQVSLGIAISTAPSSGALPGGLLKPLLFSGAFTILWLLSAALFRAAATKSSGEALVH